jgi:hypothetical protein
MVPLLEFDGEHAKGAKLPDRAVRDAPARRLLEKSQPIAPAGTVTVLKVCQANLGDAKEAGAEKNAIGRADTLSDFCFGLSP